MKLDINIETCTGCKLCETVCIRDNIRIIDKKAVEVDNGDCFVGDLEPFEYIEAYAENIKLKNDWEAIMSFRPKRIYYSHRPEKIMD